jgi:hypothetical protein
MEVTFTKTGDRRYRVSVEGTKVGSYMDPAPGYHALLPHDMAHFIVENELGIDGGVFGQLAAGGTAGSFVPAYPDERKRRRLARRGQRRARSNRKDAALSERVIFLAWQVWQKQVAEVPALERFAPRDIRRVCEEFEAASAIWSKLAIGESMTLKWRARGTRSGHSRRWATFKEQRIAPDAIQHRNSFAPADLSKAAPQM